MKDYRARSAASHNGGPHPLYAAARESSYWFAAALMGIILVILVGPIVETALFPVFSRFEVVSVEPDPRKPGSIIRVSFRKLRNCAPVGLQWYRGEAGDSEAIEAQALIPVLGPLPLGEHESRPYHIDATPEEVASVVQAVIVSDCGMPWGLTTSRVFP